MQINRINSNINFNGYKNVISNPLKFDDGVAEILSLQLDNQGEKDLDAYKSLLDSCPKYRPHSNLDDVVTFVYINKQGEERFGINSRGLLTGPELRLLSLTLPHDEYLKQETPALKAYTLFASITRRLKADLSIVKDSDLKRVFQHAFELFTEIGLSQERARETVSTALLKNKPYGKVAGVINEKIQHTMTILFK